MAEPCPSAGSLEGVAPDMQPGCVALPIGASALLAASCRVRSENAGQGLQHHRAPGSACVAWSGAACH